MAEINKIKVGETTYDVNPSWATGDGVTTPLKMGTNGALTIGTAGLISMSTAVSIGNSLTVDGNIVCQQNASFEQVTTADGSVELGGGPIKLGSAANSRINIVGQLSINGVGFDPATIPTSASIKGIAVDSDNLIIGTGKEIQNIYIGTTPWGGRVLVDTDKVRMKATSGYAEIGGIVGYQCVAPNDALLLGSGICGKKQNVQVGLDDTNISVMALDSGYNKLDKVSIKASTIDLPTATKLYFNGIPISKSGNALIFDDQNTELSLNSGWRLTQDKLEVHNVEASKIKLVNMGGGTSLEGLESFEVSPSNGEFLVEDGRILAMWSGYGIRIGNQDDGSRSVRIEGKVEFPDGIDTTNLFKSTEELNLPTVNKMYFGHIPVTVIGTADSYEPDGESQINTKMQISNKRFSDAFCVQTGISDNTETDMGDVKGSIGIFLGTYYGEPYLSCYSKNREIDNGVYVNHDNTTIKGDPVFINDFKFDCDKENSKLIISYNGKKAEIQLN